MVAHGHILPSILAVDNSPVLDRTSQPCQHPREEEYLVILARSTSERVKEEPRTASLPTQYYACIYTGLRVLCAKASDEIACKQVECVLMLSRMLKS